MERIRAPAGKRLRAITKPGTARTRRTELALVERSDQAMGITLGHSGGNAPGFAHPGSFMTKAYTFPTIDQYLRERLMPVKGTIPNIVGIDMYGKSIPAGTVGGDLFEYINFQQRYDITARIQRALRLSNEFLEPLPPGAPLRNSVDDHVQWLKARPDYSAEIEMEFRDAKSSEQVRVAEDLNDLYFTAGVLLVDAQGHGIISAKIASTVHDTFHALMLTELDR